jgi:sugar lactone lactonase YvrE
MATKNFNLAKLARNINIEDDGSIAFNSEVSAGGETIGSLTASMDSDQTSTITLSKASTPVPIVQAYKEIPQTGVSSKGQWNVNANATNYDFFDEKPISYASSTLTPSATGDGTFTSSTPTIIPNKFSLIPDFGTTQNTYATTGMSSYYINTSVNDGSQPQSKSVAVSPDGTKAIVLQWNTSSFGKQRLHSWNLQTAFGINSAYVWQAGTGYDPVNSQWLHQGYYDVTIGGTDVAHRHGHFGVDPSGVHFYFHRSTTTYYYKASTAWDVTTLSYQNKTFAPSGNGVPASNQNVQGAEISSNGSYLIYCSGNYVATYTMSTAFDVSTASSGSKQEVDVVSILTSAGLTVTGDLRSAMFNSDGTELLTNIHYSSHHHRAYKFTLSTAWDITTASYVQNSESSNGGYNLKFFEQSSSDNTWVSFTVDGSIDVAIVQLDEISQFNLNDVGKKVVGNSGSAIITATSGTYTSVTPFADTSAISSWQLFGAEGKTDGSGIQLTSIGGGYDFSNLSYTGRSFYLTGAVATLTSAQGMAMKPDGTKMWVLDKASEKIVEFSLSTPYEIDTASSTGTTLVISSYESAGSGIHVNSEGTRLIIIGSNQDEWNEFHLSTGWDLTTATHDQVKSIADLTSGVTAPQDLVFNDDGTRMFILSPNMDNIFGYTLSTAFDISGSSLTSAGSLSIASIETSPGALNINNDGTELYISGTQNDNLQMLKLDTAYDLSSYNASESLTYSWTSDGTGIGTTAVEGITISKDGTKLYLTAGSEYIYEYDFGAAGPSNFNSYSPALTKSSTGQINSSAWLDINSMTADETKNGGDIFYAVSTDNRTSWGVAKASDGVRKIVKNNSGTWQYNNDAGSSTVVGYDLSSSATLNKTLSYNSQDIHGAAMAFNNDGTKLYFTGEQNNIIHEYVLSTAYDISTSSYNSVTFNPSILATVDIKWKPDGTKVYIMDYDSSVRGTIYTFNVSTAWDITTASSASETFRGNAQDSSFIKFAFKTDGTRLYKLGRQGNRIHAYDLSTAWDVSSASYASEELPMANVVANSTVGTYMNGLAFNSSGTKVFVAVYHPTNTSNNRIYEIDLSTAWDIGIDNNNNGNYAGVYLNTDRVINVLFNGDGSQVYAMNTTTDTILSYSSGSASIVYSTSETWVNGTNNNEHATLQEALGAQSFNRMNKAQLDAVADAYHFSQDSADTLDLMIAPYAASGTSPISDGVTINYDAASKYRQAVPETDYRVDFSGTSTVEFTSNISANFKVKVV